MNNINTQQAPVSLVSSSGTPTYGYFDGPVSSLGLEHFNYRTDMDKPASALAKHFHFKQFQFVSIVTENFIIGVAIADIRYLGNGFCYLYDIKQNKIVETSWLKFGGLGYQMTPSPMNGLARIANRNGEVCFHLTEGNWHLSINTQTISADLKLVSKQASLPIAMCNPTGYRGWTYTQKHNGLTPHGHLAINGVNQSLNDALAGYDFSAGYMRRETSWRWASINATTKEAGNETKIIGLNLAAGVNETGGNENVFWCDKERHLLPAVHFDFQRKPVNKSTNAIDSTWHIYSDNGQIDLHFCAKNCRFERLNLWLLKSNFRQFIGYFTGYIIDNDGNKHTIDNIIGLTEDHFARW
ncbi:DUF2804 domain-containing protein [Colwelliaceae bacterium 6471]